MPGHRRRGSHGGGRAGGTARGDHKEGDHKEDEWGSSLQRKLGAADDEAALLLLQQQSPGQLASARPDAHGHTLVHTCAIAGHERCLEYLLGAVALPVDSKDRDDKSPLHHAAYHNHPCCVDALLRYGADADAKAENRKFKSVMCRHHLQNACPFGDRCHFAHGPSELRGGPDGAKRRVTTPFESAIKGQIQAGKASQAALLPDARSRFTAVCKGLWEKSEEFPKVLHRVCKSAEALKMVSQFAIDCNLTKVEDWWQWTLLHHAAHVGDLESLRALIAADIELINQVDSQGKTALHRAAQWGRGPCVRELLQQGAVPTVRNNFGMTPLQDALRVEADHEEVVQLLLQNLEVLADAQRSAAEGYVPLQRVLNKHAALIEKMHGAERVALPDGKVHGVGEQQQLQADGHFSTLDLGELTASLGSGPVGSTQPAESRFAGMSGRADAEADAAYEERYAGDFEPLVQADADPQHQPLVNHATAPQRRTPQPQSSQRRTPQPHGEAEPPGGAGAGVVLWGWGAAVSPGSLGQNHESSELSPPKPVPGANDMLAGVSALWRPLALPTQSFTGPSDHGEGAAEPTLPLGIRELGFGSRDQQALPRAAGDDTRGADGQESQDSAGAGMPGGIWHSVVPSAGGMEGGWAAAAQFQQPFQQPASWDLSTPCVGVDAMQHDGKQFGGDGGTGGHQSHSAGGVELPDSRRGSRRGPRRRGTPPTRS